MKFDTFVWFLYESQESHIALWAEDQYKDMECSNVWLRIFYFSLV